MQRFDAISENTGKIAKPILFGRNVTDKKNFALLMKNGDLINLDYWYDDSDDKGDLIIAKDIKKIIYSMKQQIFVVTNDYKFYRYERISNGKVKKEFICDFKNFDYKEKK